MSAAQNRPVRRRAATKAPHAAVGGASSSARLNDVTGPNAAVSGHMSTPTDGVELAHAARLYPVGAPIACEYSGLIPCDKAYAHQPMAQM